MKKFKELRESKKPKVGAPIWNIKYPKPKEGYRPIVKESSWQNYRAQALMESAELNIPEHTTQEIANKHGFTIQHIEAQLERGIKVEGEHTTHVAPAREIALDHLWENPNYYTILKKAQLEGCLLEEGYSETQLNQLYRKQLKDPKKHGAEWKRAYAAHAIHSQKQADRMYQKDPYGDAEKLKEGLTPREKMSGDERLKPVKPAPMDQAGKQKQALVQHDKTNDTVQHRFSQGGNDSGSRQALHSLKEDTQYSQYLQHYNLFRKHEHQATNDPSHKEAREHHRKAMTMIYSKMSPEVRIAIPRHMRLSESVEGYKVGDKVVANIGPHKGQVHTVIHVHPTGHLNIKPDVAHVSRNKYRLGAAKADPKDVTRHLGEAKADNYDVDHMNAHVCTKGEISYSSHSKGCPTTQNRGKQFKKWPKGMHTTSSGINRKTIQEIFQASKGKKDGTPAKQDNLPNDGANEPNKEIPGAPGVQPQDAKGPQDNGAPQPGEGKKDNTPKSENPNSKKMQVKGPGADDKFQPDPQVTPLTHMPDTGNPRNGSAATR